MPFEDLRLESRAGSCLSRLCQLEMCEGETGAPRAFGPPLIAHSELLDSAPPWGQGRPPPPS